MSSGYLPIYARSALAADDGVVEYWDGIARNNLRNAYDDPGRHYEFARGIDATISVRVDDDVEQSDGTLTIESDVVLDGRLFRTGSRLIRLGVSLVHHPVSGFRRRVDWFGHPDVGLVGAFVSQPWDTTIDMPVPSGSGSMHPGDLLVSEDISDCAMGKDFARFFTDPMPRFIHSDALAWTDRVAASSMLPGLCPTTSVFSPYGEMPLGELQAGDRVMTLSHGLIEIEELRIVHLPSELMGFLVNYSGSDGEALVSPFQKVQVPTDRAFGRPDIIVQARFTIDHPGVQMRQPPRSHLVLPVFRQTVALWLPGVVAICGPSQNSEYPENDPFAPLDEDQSRAFHNARRRALEASNAYFLEAVERVA